MVGAGNRMNRSMIAMPPFEGLGVVHGKQVAQSIPNNTQTTIVWDKALYTPKGGYLRDDGATLYVPPGAKFVQLGVNASWASNTTGTRELAVWHNATGKINSVPLLGASYCCARDVRAADTLSSGFVITGPLLVKPGDSFFAQAFQTSGGALNLAIDARIWMEILE